MRSKNEHNGPGGSPDYRELQLLAEIEEDPEVSQRQLSQRVGIALGLTNIMLRNLAQKGYVRATQASWRRWVYALTPEGFSHKIRLTVAYVGRVMNHYQSVRQTLREQLQPLALHKESRVAICGTGELAELVYLALKELRIEEIDIFGPSAPTVDEFLGMPVQDVATLQFDRYDRVLIAALGKLEETFSELLSGDSGAAKLVTFFPQGRIKEKV